MSDLISREDTIADLHTADIPDEWMEWMENFINAQPSVETERKHGHWIMQNDTNKKLLGWSFCSECNVWKREPTNYCSKCGADMREVKE